MSGNLLKSFLKFSYGSWVGLILGVLTTVIITRMLPPGVLGKSSMFDLFIQVGMILTIFGADQSFVRFFSEELSDKRGKLLYNCLRIPILTALVMILIIFVFYEPITIFLFGKASFILAIVVSIGIIAQLLFRFGQLVVRMQQKGNMYSILQITQKFVDLILIITFFYFIGSRFEALVYSKVLTFTILFIIAVYIGKQFWHISNIKIKEVKHPQSEIIRFGSPFVLTIFISWLFESFDKIALRQWSDFEELGLYAAAMRLVALAMVLKQTFSTFWTPVSYERFENNPEDKDFFRNISIIVSFFLFLVAIVSILAKDMIVILLGTKYQYAADIMPFLVFMPILYTISETTVIGINFHKKVKWHILIACISCGVNVIGNWIMVPNYGALGASVSTAFSFVIFFTLRTVISNIYYKVKYPLLRIYIMVVFISIHASVTIIIDNLWGNILIGTFSLILLLFLFYKDLIYFIKKIST